MLVHQRTNLGKETEVIAAVAGWWTQDGSTEFSISAALRVLFLHSAVFNLEPFEIQNSIKAAIFKSPC